MPDYQWSCLACGVTNAAGASTCVACRCPACATTNQIRASRRHVSAEQGSPVRHGSVVAAAEASASSSWPVDASEKALTNAEHTSEDPDWGRSKPRSKGLGILVLLLSGAAILWGMVEAVNYGRELEHPLGLIDFVELFPREVFILVLVVLALLALPIVQLWQYLQRRFLAPDQVTDQCDGNGVTPAA